MTMTKWILLYLPFVHVTKHGLSTGHLPTSSCPRSYWMTPSRLSHIMDVKCFPRSGITTPTLFDYMVWRTNVIPRNSCFVNDVWIIAHSTNCCKLNSEQGCAGLPAEQAQTWVRSCFAAAAAAGSEWLCRWEPPTLHYTQSRKIENKS